MSADGARIAPCPSVSARYFTAFPDVFEDSVAVAVSLCDAENDVQGRRGPPRRGDTCRTAKWVVLQSRLPTAAHRLDRCRTASRMDGSTCHREDCRLSCVAMRVMHPCLCHAVAARDVDHVSIAVGGAPGQVSIVVIAELNAYGHGQRLTLELPTCGPLTQDVIIG